MTSAVYSLKVLEEKGWKEEKQSPEGPLGVLKWRGAWDVRIGRGGKMRKRFQISRGAL